MKGKRTDLSTAHCAIARSLEIVGDWWSLLIIRDAFRGHERFSEFQKNLGLAKNILSARLKKLVDAGIFSIEADPDSALSHRYVLTPKVNRSTRPRSLWQWGEEGTLRATSSRWPWSIRPRASRSSRCSPRVRTAGLCDRATCDSCRVSVE